MSKTPFYHFGAGLGLRGKTRSEEEKRGVSEQLSEEGLALFDILTKPEIDMTAKEKEEVKKVARMLLQTLKEAKLVLDWRNKQRSRAGVYTTVKDILGELPRAYTQKLYQQKCDSVYQHVYDSYQGEAFMRSGDQFSWDAYSSLWLTFMRNESRLHKNTTPAREQLALTRHSSQAIR